MNHEVLRFLGVTLFYQQMAAYYKIGVNNILHSEPFGISGFLH